MSFLSFSKLLLLLSLLPFSAALAAGNSINPDPGRRTGAGCCKPCGCRDSGDGSYTDAASYWNFLSGRFEQQITLQTGNTSLSMPELTLHYSNIFAPLKETNVFANYWLLSAGEYLSAAADGSDAYEYYQPGDATVLLKKNTEGLYYSVPDRQYTLKRQANGSFILTDILGRRKNFSAPRTTADGVIYLRLEKVYVPGKAEAALTYTAAGKLEKIINALSGTAVYTLRYNADGLCNLILDAAGRPAAAFAYDDRQLLTKVNFGESLSQSYQFTYNDEYRIVKKTRPNGGEVTYTYERGTGKLVTAALPNGSRFILLSDKTGSDERIRVIGANGEITEFTLLAGKEDYKTAKYADGRTVSRTFNGSGQITRQQGSCPACDGNGALDTEYTYDNNGRLTQTAYYQGGQRLAVEKYTYDGAGNKSSFTAKDGTVTRYTYDGQNRLIKTDYPDGATVATTYNAAGQIAAITDELGNVTRYEYNAAGQKTVRITADGARTEYGYDVYGRNTTIKQADGSVIALEYDAIGYLCGRTDGAGHREKWTNDAKGNRLTYTDANNNLTAYQYNGQWQLVKTIFPDGTAEEYTLDGYGRQTAVRHRDDTVTRREYNLQGKVIADIRADGARTVNQYDSGGRLLAVADYLGNLTAFAYDPWGNISKTTDPQGNVTEAVYDVMGRRIAVTDKLGNRTSFAYDSRGRLLQQTDALGNVTRMTYDKAGNLLTLTDANGNTSTWTYGKSGKAESLTYPNGDIERYAYDALQRLTQKTKPDGTAIKYVYGVNGIEKIQTPQGELQFTYDVFGRAAEMRDYTLPEGVIGRLTYDYDNFNRVIRVTDHNLEQTITYEYDLFSRKTKVNLDNESIVYRYNINGWLHEVQRSGENSPAVYEYNRNGQRTKLTLPNGVFTEYAYNPAGYMTSIISRNNAGAVLSSAEYTLDKNGNRNSLRLNLGGKQQIARYTFDNIYRLTGEKRTAVNAATGSETPLFTDVFSYDAIGNRLSRTHTAGANTPERTTYTYNVANQLIAETNNGVAKTYTYDKNGNTVSITEPGGTITMQYDWLNRQTKWTDGTNTETTVFRGAGWQRISSTVTAPTLTSVTKYLYDGDNVIADYNAANTQKAFYVTPFLDQNLSVKISNTQPYYYIQDGLGSVRGLTDTNGTLVNHYDYTAFGEPYTAGTSETVPNRYTYTGREKSPIAVAPMYYRWRNYAPGIGRFL